MIAGIFIIIDTFLLSCNCNSYGHFLSVHYFVCYIQYVPTGHKYEPKTAVMVVRYFVRYLGYIPIGHKFEPRSGVLVVCYFVCYLGYVPIGLTVFLSLTLCAEA